MHTNIDIQISNLMKVKKRDKQTSLLTSNKIEAYKKVWCITDNILPVTYLKNMQGGNRLERDFCFFICLYVCFDIFIIKYV